MRGRSSEEAVRDPGDASEQLRRVDAQAFECSATQDQDVDQTRSGILGDGADGIPPREFGRGEAREPYMPGFVAVDATHDRGDGRFLGQNASGREQSSEDVANRGIE